MENRELNIEKGEYREHVIGAEFQREVEKIFVILVYMNKERGKNRKITERCLKRERERRVIT